MLHNIVAEFLGTALMNLFGVGVHCDEVLNKTKYRGSGHLFAITTWGFGITVVIFVFGGVCLNPAMALAQAILGMISWKCFIPYCVAEFLGALCGACIRLSRREAASQVSLTKNSLHLRNFHPWLLIHNNDDLRVLTTVF